MTAFEALLALVIGLGLVGILVPVLPGSLLVLVAIAVWSWHTGGPGAWGVLAVASVVLVAGGVAKYLLPGRRLTEAGIPASTLWLGALVGVVGFFVVPVVGLLLGFALGVYLAELRRIGSARAWPSTVHALRAAGLSLLVELLAGVLAALVWVAGVVLT